MWRRTLFRSTVKPWIIMESETEKGGINITYWGGKACEYISMQGMLTLEACNHSRHIGTRAQKAYWHMSTLACNVH